MAVEIKRVVLATPIEEVIIISDGGGKKSLRITAGAQGTNWTKVYRDGEDICNMNLTQATTRKFAHALLELIGDEKNG